MPQLQSDVHLFFINEVTDDAIVPDSLPPQTWQATGEDVPETGVRQRRDLFQRRNQPPARRLETRVAATSTDSNADGQTLVIARTRFVSVNHKGKWRGFPSANWP